MAFIEPMHRNEPNITYLQYILKKHEIHLHFLSFYNPDMV